MYVFSLAMRSKNLFSKSKGPYSIITIWAMFGAGLVAGFFHLYICFLQVSKANENR